MSSQHKPSFLPVRIVCRLRETKRKPVVRRLNTVVTTAVPNSMNKSLFQLGGNACSMVEAREIWDASEMWNPRGLHKIECESQKPK